MDLEPEKPDAEREGVSVTDNRGENFGDAGESIPKTVTGANAIRSSGNNTPVAKTIQEELANSEDSLDITTEESIPGKKNPMLLSPVRLNLGFPKHFSESDNSKAYSCIFHIWNSAGKQALTSRAMIRFKKDSLDRLPIDFYSCFLNSAARFSSFQFYGGSWTIEESSKFFDEQQKTIKKLALNVANLTKDGAPVKNFDISPWISKSPMVTNGGKFLTKLSIHKVDCAIPLSLLKHTKDLSLSYCRVNLKAGVQIHPVKLYLKNIGFYQDVTLASIQINDIVKFSSANEIYLDRFSYEPDTTKFAIDLSGYCRLDSLTLLYVDVINLETSMWDIRHMRLDSLDGEGFHAKEMTINELSLFPDGGGDFDLFDFPQSIEKLAIGESEEVNITCSEPTTLENLKYFSVAINSKADYSFLAHFMNYPQLAHLKFFWEYGGIPEIKLTCIPKAVRTLTLDRCSIDWLFGSYCYAHIEKIVVFETEINFERISKAKISVDDIIFLCNEAEQEVPKSVANFFNNQNPWNICKRFYIGNLRWDEMKLEDSVLNEHVDTKSAFYVFENGEMGRALDEKSFNQLADIPPNVIMDNHNFES